MCTGYRKFLWHEQNCSLQHTSKIKRKDCSGITRKTKEAVLILGDQTGRTNRRKQVQVVPFTCCNFQYESYCVNWGAHSSTIHRRLSFFSCHELEKPFLREQNVMKRTLWGLIYYGWSIPEWARAFLTDESTFLVRPEKKKSASMAKIRRKVQK